MILLFVKNAINRSLLIILLLLWLQNNQILSYEVIEKCEQGCNSLVNLEENVFDIACNDSCKLQQCRIGCQRWTEAQPTCTQACNDSSSVNNWVLYCVLGCNHALTVYIDKIKSEVSTPSAPYLVADSLTNESLTIEWKSSSYSNITYLVQWRYELLGGDWNYYMPNTSLNTSRVQIKGLYAYTQYRFRIEWIVLRQYGMTLFSDQSVVISTLAYGVPSSPPTMKSLIPVSTSQISVSWEPPRFPNGPIISYALYLNEYPSGPTIVKDILNSHTNNDKDINLAHNKSLHYMWNGLKANTTYIISIVTRNNFGEGPKAQTNCTTFESDINESEENESNLPDFILATDKEVLRKDPLNPLNEEVVFRLNDFTTSADISGLAVHVEYKYLFASDTSGTVRRVSLKNENNKQVRTLVRGRRRPSHLSVDWLGDKLYMIEETKISRCNLDGDRMEFVITEFKSRPADMKVDPYNGYLYWLSISDSNIASLYRVDLALIATHAITYNYANLIFQESSVTTFAVDFINYRIYVPISREASIFSITIDGNDRTNIRQNSQRSDQLENIENLVVHENLFYFTKGSEVFREEYESDSGKYHHSSQEVQANALVSLCVLDYKSQPYPVPLNPVKNVQSVFLDTSAKIVWEKPDLLGDKGQGAWQRWSYEVSIEETLSRQNFLDRGLAETYCEAAELSPNTEYDIRVRAYSRAGNGTWSHTFHGKTLHQIKAHSRHPFALWSTREGVLKSNIVGDRVEHLVHRMNMNGTAVNDISWYRDVIFLNGENHIYIYNLTSHASLTRINNITTASSIAVDWLAPKLYWSSPSQRMISRSNLDGSHSEPLPIMTFAKEIAIDSVMGYIYWATGYSVEFSRLNGMNRMKYTETDLFSGKHIMGLTLNFDQNLIFWILRSYDGVVLYSASLAGKDNAEYVSQTIKFVGQLSESHLRGPLSYYSDRMFWLEEQQNHALISEVNGENFAVLKGLGLNDINTVTVIDPSLQPIPDGFKSMNEVQVIPNDLKVEDIKLTGSWDNFTIFWKKCENVNFDEVFYELVIEDSHQNDKHSMITRKTKYPYPLANRLPPYSKIKLAIRTFTYWASSKQTIIELYSPMSIPTKPSKPRCFINYERSTYDNSIDKIHAEFRWSPPELPNGVILGYTVNAWSLQSGQKTIEVEDIKVLGQSLQIYLSDLKINTTYYFQVQAFTEAGDGPPSDIISAHSSQEHPVPRLLVTKRDSIRMADIDSREEKILTTKAIIPVSVTYISKENLMFWVEEDGILKKSYLDGSNITIIHQMYSLGSGLSVDWIGRRLYWAESDISSPKSTIYSFDLNNPMARPVLITTKNNVIISNLEIDPFSSTLIWTEMFNNKQGQMKMCSSDPSITPSTSNVKLFFQQNKLKTKGELTYSTCNCAAHPVVGSSLAIDRSIYGESELLWFDAKNDRIMASDMSGCHCKTLINSTYGFPPTSMSVDNDFIYWSNSSLGNVYKIEKQNKNTNKKSESLLTFKSMPNLMNSLQSGNIPHLVLSESVNAVHGIRALSDHLQPYPNFECLVPMEYQESIRLMDNTANSLTIYLQEVRRPLGCSKTTLASVLYTIFYGKVLSDGDYECGLSLRGCRTIETYNDTITISGLEPFTNYTIRVAVKNYYTPNNSINLPGPPVIFETAESKPSPPRNVMAKVETPHKIMITWEPPEKPNGDTILYEMRWYSSKDQNWHKAIYTKKPNTTRFGDRFIMRLTENIKPGLTYHINIRAYSSDGLYYSDSEVVSVTTYNLPEEILLQQKGSRFLKVSWISPLSDSGVSEIGQHTIQYSQFGSQRWIGQEFNKTQPSTKYIFTITNLLPNTEYTFRLILTYRSTTSIFEWPENEKYVFKTMGDAPEPPDSLKIVEITGVNQPLYKVYWNKVSGNGAQNIWYNLWYKLSDKSEESTDRNEWTIVYNSTENYWFIDGLPTDKNYIFKVGAISEFGSSNFSKESEIFEYIQTIPPYTEDQDPMTIVSIISGALVFVVIILILSVTIRRHQIQELKKNALEDNRNSELELVPWPELPSHSHQMNILYTNSCFDWDNELKGITKIKRDQMTETQFLGSGAFGEVFEGYWHQKDGNSSKMTKVAIKTLRKGASDEEKSNFLKEAKLMADFKHPHILQLQCICLDPTMISLILELMEGGDLLKYLRNNRPRGSIASPLTMDDLISICTDVAKGCKYLEEVHFIHRDLAARNCLVSGFDRNTRVVKIGDFGLARDIYKHDYYRKEGEGLLPVRWMAPESLIDGVFTSQSDVWSFGVLLYEVMSLGQQPYQARTNTEVLNYVRIGGTLDRPHNCPDEMFQLMRRCWTFQREDRPNFAHCLMALEEMKKNMSGSLSAITAVHNQNYIYNRGFDNPGYSEDERQAGNSTHSMKNMQNSCESTSSNSTLRASYQNGHIKYLDMIDVTKEGFTDADGYQIPISKSPLHLSPNDNNKLLNTMNQIVVLNTNCDENVLRPAPTASVRRKQLIDSTGSGTPPPTYSQVFKTTEVVLNSDLNSCEPSANNLLERSTTNSSQHSLSSSHEKTKNCNQILVKTEHKKRESTPRLSNAKSHSSLSSSPISCSTSSSSSPIIAAALLKSQSSLSQISQPSRHMIETKYCFNGNSVHCKSVTNSSVEGSEEDYDTDFDTETIAANDLFCNINCDNNLQNQSLRSTTTTAIITSYSNPLINVKINEQNQSKYALITRLDRKSTSFPSDTNNSFKYDPNSSWC